MTDLVADLKRLRLYGMAACYADGLEQGQPVMTTATAGLAQLVQAEATDRAFLHCHQHLVVLRQAADQVLVQRLGKARVDNGRGKAEAGELLGRLQALGQARTQRQ